MDVTFYVFLGFLFGVTVMCAMVIAVSVKDTSNHSHQSNKSPKDSRDSNDKVVFKRENQDYYTYNAAGQKRKVRNVRYRD